MVKVPKDGPRGQKLRTFQRKTRTKVVFQGKCVVISDLQLADFEVEAEVKIPTDYKGFNSGLGFRLVGDKGKPKGYQFERPRQTWWCLRNRHGRLALSKQKHRCRVPNGLTTYSILRTGAMYVSSVRIEHHHLSQWQANR